MRNLRNIQRSITTLPGDLPLTATVWDGQDLICAQGPIQGRIELSRLDQNNNVSSLADWVIDHPSDEILSLQYFADSAATCLILASGDIILAKDDGIEIIGSIDVGIKAAAWSPDEELVAIATGSDTLLFMTRDFENVADITLSPEDVKASSHVSVGWGKKETQFQGKRAKALRDPTVPEKVDSGTPSENDSGKVSISWRGDGAYVAINSITIVEDLKRRMIRVYSREGILDSVGEPVDFLDASLSWRPAGNIIAGIQRLQNQIQVVFFERNGLRHGQFDLRVPPDEIQTLASQEIELKWNVDSTVLAICFRDRIQLWTMNNYHYYLKREISAIDASHGQMLLTWHPEVALQFSLSVAERLCQRFEFIFDVTAGPTNPPYDSGLVPVIDGSKCSSQICVLKPDFILHKILTTIYIGIFSVALMSPQRQ